MTLDPYELDAALPDPLPADPMPIFGAWFAEAREKAVQPNPDAMTLATVDADGSPAARIVLCKSIDESLGSVTFFTNRSSPKGQALAAEPRVALVFHWDGLDRQVRIEGVATPTPDAVSDAYFQSRRTESKLGSWASDQSEPIASRDEILAKVAAVMGRFGVTLDNFETADIPRPDHWGGYEVRATTIELWISGPGRVHDRARWERTLTPTAQGVNASEWGMTRLQP